MNSSIKFNDIDTFIYWVEHQKRFSPKVSLDKMFFYMHLFGDPHLKFKSIHVTGTNGKGSVVAYLKSVLMEAGLNVATYTSPYISCFNERIMFNNEMISDQDLLDIGNEITSKYEDIINSGYDLPTFFEFITILAFIYYSRLKNLDLVIVEVGMGGLLDSTNVITPLISVITNITLEHQKILGNTLEEIAIQKLGIVKNKVPLVTSNHNKILKPIFDSITQKLNTQYFETLPEAVEILKQDIYSTEILKNDVPYTVGLAGDHQIENALCAMLTLDTLKSINKKWNNLLSYETYYRGFKNVKWIGRLEVIMDKPLILIDGCHNIDGVLNVTNFIKRLPYQYKRAVVSISNDKNKKEMLDLISQTFDEVICTKYAYARSAEDEELYQLLDHKNKKIIPTVQLALNYTLENEVELTCFIGSLYLVSEIRNIIKPIKH